MPWQNLVDFFMSWLRISMLQKLLSKQVHDEKLRCTFFTCFTAARESAISSSSSGDDRPPKSLSLLLPLSIIIPAPQRGINQQAEERDKRIRKKKTLAWKEEEKGLFVSCCLWVYPIQCSTFVSWRRAEQTGMGLCESQQFFR